MTLVIFVCCVALLGGFLLKGQCLAGYDGRQYQRLCYNDIQPLYGPRIHIVDDSGVERLAFPYERGLRDGQLQPGAVEYPVLTGVFMWATGALASEANQYLKVSALFLAPFGILVAYLLALMTGRRALLWAAAPAIVFYAFHNWDLLVVAAAVTGFYLWWSGKPVAAALAFGIGGALKMYPAFFVVPLVLEALFDKRKGDAVKIGLTGFGSLIAINLPFAIKSFDGWWATYEFHSQRGADFNSIWHWLTPGLAVEKLNLVTFGLTGLSFVVILGVSWIRARKDQIYPFVGTSAALLAAFLLWNKVHSPQYALWILPFFALTRINIGWWIAYAIADALVYVGIFEWFHAWQFQGAPDSGWQDVLIVGIWFRAAMLAVLTAIFLWIGRPPAPEPISQPAPKPA